MLGRHQDIQIMEKFMGQETDRRVFSAWYEVNFIGLVCVCSSFFVHTDVI